MSATLAVSARALLGDWMAPDATQSMLRGEFLQWIDHHPRPTSRTADPHHLTASGLVVSHDLARVALVHHRKFGRWLQTGGHIEDTDADVPAAALREATEETGVVGLVIDPTPVLLSRHRVKCWPDGDHLDVQFVLTAPAEATLVCSSESDALEWWPVTALPTSTDDSVRALVMAATQRLRETHAPAHTAEPAAPTP